MAWEPIRKDSDHGTPRPNFGDYGEACARFSWGSVRKQLGGLPCGGLNIAHEAVDRHAAGPLQDRVAIRWIGKEDQIVDFTYSDLREKTNRFANVLRALGLGKGDTICALSGRIPDLYIAALGTLKNRGIFCPLFSAFGPEPLQQRLAKGNAKALLTTSRLYRKNIAALRSSLPALKQVLLVDGEEAGEGVHALPALMSAASADFTIPPTDPEDIALLHFTSGTTGTPKGALHVHNAVVMHLMTGQYVLDLHPDDVFWCTADPGWVTGTSYGIIAPLVLGVTNIVDEADFDAERWYRILEREKVTVWYTAPTAIRMLMRLPGEPRKQYDLRRLRLIASVGEPLNPAAVVWGQQALGLPIHDNWWQTETGGIMIANFRSMEIRPGSMGRPLPGVEAAVVRRLDASHVEEIREPNVAGELALRPGWPSMFRGYLHDEERYRKCFQNGWYITGDLASRDADGYYTFVGRSDDIIKTAGHMVGPFEVESALLEHPAVAEAGVIGKPDPIIGEIVKAFVALKPGNEPSEELRLDLVGFARKKLGSVVAPKEIEFQTSLPRTRSGKIMRRLLKMRELGLPEGDLSTLEPAS
ncbi:MAG TPA: acetate--CoA ligase [Bryobacteraceae bacterium]|nr:acetate--CoA ligase [Bryobacteraceae bacterium]